MLFHPWRTVFELSFVRPGAQSPLPVLLSRSLFFLLCTTLCVDDALQTNEGLTQFQWKNRLDDSVDPNCDHMVFPGDAKFEKVNTGREGDRVVMLQFSSNSSRRFFFWLQHKKDDDDEELTKKMNDAINGVSSAEEAPSTEEETAVSAANTGANTGATPATQPAAFAV